MLMLPGDERLTVNASGDEIPTRSRLKREPDRIGSLTGSPLAVKFCQNQ